MTLSTRKQPDADGRNESGGLRERLQKTRTALSRGLGSLFSKTQVVSEAVIDDLEDLLITSDVGVDASRRIVDRVRTAANEHKVVDAKGVTTVLRDEIISILAQGGVAKPFAARPYVLLVVGVNGVGKTTTIAKIAKRLTDEGKKVTLAAADTFRAAAVEQLQRWGERIDVAVVAQHTGADAAAVAHDALASALAKRHDVLIVDTAGRQHTQSDLMEQLRKVKRVLRKLDSNAPHEVMQVVDAGTGQNALSQLEHFRAAVNVDTLCVTKLDGTAKGGVLIALVDKFKIPVRYIGIGEGFDDLRPFEPERFAQALIPNQPLD